MDLGPGALGPSCLRHCFWATVFIVTRDVTASRGVHAVACCSFSHHASRSSVMSCHGTLNFTLQCTGVVSLTGTTDGMTVVSTAVANSQAHANQSWSSGLRDGFHAFTTHDVSTWGQFCSQKGHCSPRNARRVLGIMPLRTSDLHRPWPLMVMLSVLGNSLFWQM